MGWGCNLTAGTSVANQIAIEKAGGIELVVLALLGYPDIPELQASASRALSNIAASARGLRDSIANSGAIPALAATLQSHPDSALVQRFACAALSSIVIGSTEHKAALIAFHTT